MVFVDLVDEDKSISSGSSGQETKEETGSGSTGGDGVDHMEDSGGDLSFVSGECVYAVLYRVVCMNIVPLCLL